MQVLKIPQNMDIFMILSMILYKCPSIHVKTSLLLMIFATLKIRKVLKQFIIPFKYWLRCWTLNVKIYKYK